MNKTSLTQRMINYRVQREISNAQAELHTSPYPVRLNEFTNGFRYDVTYTQHYISYSIMGTVIAAKSKTSNRLYNYSNALSNFSKNNSISCKQLDTLTRTIYRKFLSDTPSFQLLTWKK